VERGGLILIVDDDRLLVQAGEKQVIRSVRFRTLGCYPIQGAVKPEAATLTKVIQEMLLTATSERLERAVDKD
jgi:sulfate adenylyltransferase subunit 2